MAETCEIEVAGGYLRMEYIQDIDGAWLEPHRDIPEKLFSMVIYLFTGPDAARMGHRHLRRRPALGRPIRRPSSIRA